jgi:acyl carrier protein
MGSDAIDPEVLEKVRGIVSKILRLDLAKVTPEASIINDLGGESIDVLEIRFHLEKTFKIKVKEKELREAIEGSTPEEIAKNFTCNMVAREVTRRLATADPK